MLAKFEVTLRRTVVTQQTVYVKIDVDEDSGSTVAMDYEKMIEAEALDQVDMTPDLWEEVDDKTVAHLIVGV